MSISREFDAVLDEIQGILLSFLLKLGPFFVALMPALFSGYAIYFTFAEVAGPELALLFAFTVGLALETVGIVATHTTIDLYNGTEDGSISPIKFWIMAGLVPVYVASVAGVIWYADEAFSPLVQALGIASPFMTCIVYVAVALARDVGNIKRDQKQKSNFELAQEREDRQHKRDLERMRLQMEQELKLKQLDMLPYAGNGANGKPASERYECEGAGCERAFNTVQALNAHKRFCEAA